MLLTLIASHTAIAFSGPSAPARSTSVPVLPTIPVSVIGVRLAHAQSCCTTGTTHGGNTHTQNKQPRFSQRYARVLDLDVDTNKHVRWPY
jgi:hypothetical protein